MSHWLTESITIEPYLTASHQAWLGTMTQTIPLCTHFALTLPLPTDDEWWWNRLYAGDDEMMFIAKHAYSMKRLHVRIVMHCECAECLSVWRYKKNRVASSAYATQATFLPCVASVSCRICMWIHVALVSCCTRVETMWLGQGWSRAWSSLF